MLLLNKEDIEKVFTMKDAIDTTKTAFVSVAQGSCQVPIRTNIGAPKEEGCFLFMPAYMESIKAAGIKIVNVFPKNTEKGLPVVPAQVLLIDGETGVVSGIMDGTYITQLRTGAASGVAFDALGRKEAKIGALIGTGGQARCQLEAMLTVRNLEEVRVFGMEKEKRETFAREMNEEFQEYGAKIVAVNSGNEAVENADLIITVTTATSPVFNASYVKKGATISGVGSYQHHMQELPPEILVKASKIYFESTEAVLSESGDITKPLKDGIITELDFTGELGNVITGQLVGRENEEEIIVFKTVGVATQDLTAAYGIYHKAIEAKVGTHWE